jgi:two-component system CheB/CheR fusion protein
MTYGQERIDQPGVSAEGDERALEALLDYLHRERGFDFSGYKRPSLTRRIHRRMASVGIASLSEYLAYLERSPDELTELFTVILINVTAFFRDRAAWDALAARLPTIVDPNADVPVRVWSAGCSSGEEPYTLAMVLSEALGEEAFARRVKIYATDIDEDALAVARLGTYPRQALEDVPPPLVEKYFTASGDRFTLTKELRRDIVFGRHDLLRDAPIPHVDVVVCRNLLMYFNPEAQQRVVENLRFALKPGGLLFLGKAEMLLSQSHLFAALDLKLRLFAPVMRSLRHGRPSEADDVPSNEVADDDARTKLWRLSFEANPVAQMVLDTTGRMVLANRKAAQFFGLTSHDLGRPLSELTLSARSSELRSGIERARSERRVARLKEVEHVYPSGEKTFLDVEVTPLPSETGALLGTQVTFADSTQSHRLRTELRRANIELEATQEELRTLRDELEAMNGVLQSTNEELETTNEELRAMNEELESVNEELQSTNEELQTINEELRQRGTELNDTSALLGAVLASLHAGVVVLDRELRVLAWNVTMAELFGVRAHEAEGKYFTNLVLESGLPLQEIAASLRATLETRNERRHTIDGTNRYGKKLTCEVRVAPLLGDHKSGAIVLVGEVS